MGTHPIFESDFDCLTGFRLKVKNDSHSSCPATFPARCQTTGTIPAERRLVPNGPGLPSSLQLRFQDGGFSPTCSDSPPPSGLINKCELRVKSASAFVASKDVALNSASLFILISDF